MVPRTILSRLSSLATRERFLRFVWGTARVLAVAGLLLILACGTDWIYDRFEDTPYWLRVGLSGLQVLVAAVLLFFLVLKPLATWLSYSELAGWLEEAFPSLRGRVRSAVELNAKNAKTAGMSRDLIAEVTRQAESELKGLPVRKAIDGKRWIWAVVILALVASLVGPPWLFAPQTCLALVQRQLLHNVEIPRSVQVAGTGATLWPAGEPIQLQFLAKGPGAQGAGSGTVLIQGEGMPAERFTLEPIKLNPEEQSVVYQATIRAPGGSFQALAWIGDGRTKEPVSIGLEPRPGLVTGEAWLILPRFVGVRPGGTAWFTDPPYEELQDRGDIQGFDGCRARVVVTANKPLKVATLQIMTPEADSPNEKESRSLPMKSVDGDPTKWSVEFDLKARETAYRVLMLDEHGYDNRKIPRRSITLSPDEPPQVLLMPERFSGMGQTSFLEDAEVDGLPVLQSGDIRISYRVRTNLSLRKTKDAQSAAYLRYRILKPGSEGRTESIPWQTKPLIEIESTPASGLYDPVAGKFGNWVEKDDIQIEFAAVESVDPERTRGRKEGGGRWAFKTAGIPELSVGDRIEYYVQVFDSRPGSKPGESEVRVKEVVDGKGLRAWINAKLDEFKRLQQLENKQSGIFGPPNPGSP
jgi:hypothetical protein